MLESINQVIVFFSPSILVLRICCVCVFDLWCNPNKHAFHPTDVKSGGASDARAESTAFVNAFVQAHPTRHPKLTAGTYSDAVRGAKAQGKLLFVYLQSEAHDDTQRFVEQVLCSEQVTQVLDHNFVCWFGSIRHVGRWL